MMPRLGQIEQIGAVELFLQYLDIVLPVHGAVGLPLHHQRTVGGGHRSFDMRNPFIQRLHPGHRQYLGLQRVMLADEVEKVLIGGVVGKAPIQLLDETAQQLESELGDAPLFGTNQRRHEDGLALLLRHLAVQQTVDQDGTSGTLAEKMPGCG